MNVVESVQAMVMQGDKKRKRESESTEQLRTMALKNDLLNMSTSSRQLLHNEYTNLLNDIKKLKIQLQLQEEEKVNMKKAHEQEMQTLKTQADELRTLANKNHEAAVQNAGSMRMLRKQLEEMRVVADKNYKAAVQRDEEKQALKNQLEEMRVLAENNYKASKQRDELIASLENIEKMQDDLLSIYKGVYDKLKIETEKEKAQAKLLALEPRIAEYAAKFAADAEHAKIWQETLKEEMEEHDKRMINAGWPVGEPMPPITHLQELAIKYKAVQKTHTR